MAVSECDLLFSIGTRFNDRITGKSGGAVFVAEHRAHLDADSGQQAGDDADKPGSGQNIHLHGGKADADSKGVNAGGNRQRQHRLGGIVVIQLLISGKALLNHVGTDERQQHKGDPGTELCQQRRKPVAEEIAQRGHQRLKTAKPKPTGQGVGKADPADRQSLADRNGKCVHREADGNQDQVK